MPINSINSANINLQKRPMLNPNNTGYAALAGIGLAMVTGMTKNKTLSKSHKYFAALFLVSVFAHLYTTFRRPSKK